MNSLKRDENKYDYKTDEALRNIKEMNSLKRDENKTFHEILITSSNHIKEMNSLKRDEN